MKKLPVLAMLSLLSFQLAIASPKQDSTSFNCLEELPSNYQQFMGAPLVITGTVEAISATIKIRVYGVIAKPQGYLLVPSDAIILSPKNKSEFTVGTNILLFASVNDQGQTADTSEIEHQTVGGDIETATSQTTRQLSFLTKSVKDVQFCKLLRSADGVVFGKVTCVADGGSMAYGRHLAHWNKASFFVTESIKGIDAGKLIQVEFPVSLSPVWKDWPSFVSGEETALILKRFKDVGGGDGHTFIVPTQTSKMTAESFDIIRATATVRGIKTHADDQANIVEDQCHETSTAQSAMNTDEEVDAELTQAPVTHRQAPSVAPPSATPATVPGPRTRH